MNSCTHGLGIPWTSIDSSLILGVMLFEGDIPGSSVDMMLAVCFELLSEVLSVDKMLIGGEGWGRIVGVELIIDPLASLPAFIVPAELIFLIPALCLSADITEPVPMLLVGLVLIIFSQ